MKVNPMKNRFFSLFENENGATSVEYAIMASLIAVVIIAAVTAVGLATNTLFSDAAEELEKITSNSNE